MECLYCRATLGLLSRGEFCNNKHRDQWRERQAELSIQRLIESFSYDKTAAEKSGSGSVSVLDWTSRDADPPVAPFAHRDSREEIKPPVTRAIRDDSEKRGGFDHGSDSDRQAPPDAGFISTIDVNKGFASSCFQPASGAVREGPQRRFRLEPNQQSSSDHRHALRAETIYPGAERLLNRGMPSTAI